MCTKWLGIDAQVFMTVLNLSTGRGSYLSYEGMVWYDKVCYVNVLCVCTALYDVNSKQQQRNTTHNNDNNNAGPF